MDGSCVCWASVSVRERPARTRQRRPAGTGAIHISWQSPFEIIPKSLSSAVNAHPAASGASRLNEDQIAERGARMARRDDREYREYLREEQRSQPGCPAREVVLDQPRHATSRAEAFAEAERRGTAS